MVPRVVAAVALLRPGALLCGLLAYGCCCHYFTSTGARRAASTLLGPPALPGCRLGGLDTQRWVVPAAQPLLYLVLPLLLDVVLEALTLNAGWSKESPWL